MVQTHLVLLNMTDVPKGGLSQRLDGYELVFHTSINFTETVSQQASVPTEYEVLTM